MLYPFHEKTCGSGGGGEYGSSRALTKLAVCTNRDAKLIVNIVLQGGLDHYLIRYMKPSRYRLVALSGQSQYKARQNGC